MKKYLKLNSLMGRITSGIQRFEDNRINLPDDKKNKIFLFGIPRHKNLGDQAIAYAEQEFLKKVAPDFSVVEISEMATTNAIPKIKKVISENDIVAFHGGGNMGDIWPGIEDLRQSVIKNFENNPIISFPQTAFFSENSNYRENSEHIYRRNSNLKLFARETETLKIMKRSFSNNKIFMVPDIVMSLDVPLNLDRKDVTFFLREDREKNSGISENIEIIKSIIKDSKMNFKMSDTVIDDFKFPITSKNREKVLLKKWEQFGKSKFIVTDRLHGMIFAKITKTPAVVLDNNNHKVRNSYMTWLKNDPNIIFIDKKISTENESDIRKWTLNEIAYRPGNSLDEFYKPLVEAFNK